MLKIRTPGDVYAFEPGTEVAVEIEWQLDEPADSLELRLVCNTAGKGDQDLEIAQTWEFPGPTTRGSETVTMSLPDAPYSFSGKFVSCIWAWELIAFPSDDSQRIEFTLAPDGKEIELKTVDKAAQFLGADVS